MKKPRSADWMTAAASIWWLLRAVLQAYVELTLAVMLCLTWPCKRSLVRWLNLDGVWGLRVWQYLAPRLFPVRLLYCLKFSLFTFIGLDFVSGRFSDGVALPWAAWLIPVLGISTIALFVSATQWLEELYAPPHEGGE